MAAATPFAPLFLSQRLRRGKEDPERMFERYGETKIPRPSGPLLWLHGASIGEILGVIPLIRSVQQQDFNILVTSGTVTSAKMAETRMPEGVLHQFVPLDAPHFVKRFLSHWKPNVALFIESDLWPNLIGETAARRIPLIIINGRMSEKSFNRWRSAPRTIGALLRQFDLCLAQSAADASRLSELGAPRIATTGNLKLDVPAPPVDRRKLDALRAAIRERPVIAAISTHPGEDEIIADVHRKLRHSFPGLLTIIAPRHPERGAAIAQMAKNAGLHTFVRTKHAVPERMTEIFVADTLGELGIICQLAPVVFVGGSLVPHGGQNPIEAIKQGTVVLHGPHVWNFAEIYSALDEGGGSEFVPDGGKLTVRIGALLKDRAARNTMAGYARQTVDKLGGALGRTLSELEPYLIQLRIERQAANA
jgi:3-deoxy-D-manno-octulosonic-acid transferase